MMSWKPNAARTGSWNCFRGGESKLPGQEQKGGMLSATNHLRRLQVYPQFPMGNACTVETSGFQAGLLSRPHAESFA